MLLFLLLITLVILTRSCVGVFSINAVDTQCAAVCVVVVVAGVVAPVDAVINLLSGRV